MIIGTGMDLTDARRIEASVTRFGARFLNRVYTVIEQAYANRMSRPYQVYAKRFAAKEAVMKALGTGLRGFSLTDIAIENDTLGKPSVTLSGGALARLTLILPPDHRAVIHLSLSDEGATAAAFVIIEALPLPQTPVR